MLTSSFSCGFLRTPSFVLVQLPFLLRKRTPCGAPAGPTPGCGVRKSRALDTAPFPLHLRARALCRPNIGWSRIIIQPWLELGLCVQLNRSIFPYHCPRQSFPPFERWHTAPPREAPAQGHACTRKFAFPLLSCRKVSSAELENPWYALPYIFWRCCSTLSCFLSCFW